MLILNIPHSSTKLLFRKCFLKDINLKNELLALTDFYTNKLYCYKNSKRVVAKFSRFVIDTERFWDNNLESMSKVGMGAIYTHGINGNRIKDLSLLNHTELAMLKNIYDKHHELLEKYTSYSLRKYGKAVIVDCHSFTGNDLKFQQHLLKKDVKKPEICIGFENYHLPENILSFIKDYFKNFDIKFNYPYSGSIVPIKYYNTNSNVISFMMETRRDMYMNETTGEIIEAKFDRLSEIYTDFFTKLDNFLYYL
jgi:N-formylglutamate amidohydrolase